MRKVLIILQSGAIFGLAVLTYCPSPENYESPIVKNVLSLISKYGFWIAFLLGFYIFCYSVWPRCLGPRREKKKFIRKLLQRINSECFHEDLENHRITLFKEVSWVRAVIRNYFYFFCHLMFYRPKWKFYLACPRLGRYLIVYIRCGLQFKKSSTMFRIELNEREKCTGVAGYIRYRRLAPKVENLPDINNIELTKLKKVEDLAKEEDRELVKEYMQLGFIKNFVDLQKIHRRAMHFYGTIIERKGQPWGVLLVDSTSESSPFTGTIKKRVDSFALTVGNIIDLEV